MADKTCFKCGESKPRSEFYKHPQMGDGLLGKCKDCTMLDVRRHRRKNASKIRAYDRERAKLPDRRAMTAARVIAYGERYPERMAATRAVNNAVRDGRLKKLPCEACGSRRVHGHHDDYSKPLEVRWLCAVHHAEAHGRLKPV